MNSAETFRVHSAFPKAAERDLVLVTRGEHKGRIGTLDDFEDRRAVIYFGTITRSAGYHLINPGSYRLATTRDLLSRNDEIFGTTFMQSTVPNEDHVSLLYEKLLILDSLYNRHLSYLTPTLEKKNLFLAFSSADRTLAKCTCIDLSELGHRVWFYEADSIGGQPFIAQMNSGIADADGMVVLASTASMESEAVRLEWTSGLARKLKEPSFLIVPAVLDDCELPPVLAAFPCADLRTDYWKGIGDIARLVAPRVG